MSSGRYKASESSLGNVVVAFDIDNTLADPDGTCYRRAVSGLLDRMDLGLDAPDAVREYEELRSKGDALERLGLSNPVHDRARPDFLAALCLTACRNPDLMRELGVARSDAEKDRAMLDEFFALHEGIGSGSFESRLEAVIAARRFCATDGRVRGFRSRVSGLARHPRIVGWSDEYRRLENVKPDIEPAPLIESLKSRGALPVVISQGRHDLQMQKIGRLGLADSLAGRVLTTEAAVKVPGVEALDASVARLIDARLGGEGNSDNDDLKLLWYFDCLIGSWSRKGPAFFGRCLHAVRQNPTAPEAALREPAFVPRKSWEEEPLHFAMVGDRYDQDVAPLIDLLGQGTGLKVHLRCGKYAHLHPLEGLPADRRPDYTITSWDSLAGFLGTRLSRELARPITTPPGIFARSDLRTEYIERGLSSSNDAVARVAKLADIMMRCSGRS